MIKAGANMIIAETQLHDRAFELHKICGKELVLQLTNNEIIWQQENLLNLLLEYLPGDCDKVAWIDADVLYQRDGWIDTICQYLQTYKLVQCFDFVVQLPRGLENVVGLDAHSFPSGIGDCCIMPSYVNSVLNEHDNIDVPTGHIWAIRRHIIDKIKFYNECVMGGADFLTARAATFKQYDPAIVHSFSKYQLHSYFEWAKKLSDEVDDSYSYIPYNLFHLNHGSIKNRGYSYRLQQLKRVEYNPNKDVYLNNDGLWSFTKAGKAKLEEPIKTFIQNRQEDT